MHTLCYHLNNQAKYCIQIHYRTLSTHLPKKKNISCPESCSLGETLGMVAGCSLSFQVGILLGKHMYYQGHLVCYGLYYYIGWG